jgi:hypothetical protein
MKIVPAVDSFMRVYIDAEARGYNKRGVIRQTKAAP